MCIGDSMDSKLLPAFNQLVGMTAKKSNYRAYKNYCERKTYTVLWDLEDSSE